MSNGKLESTSGDLESALSTPSSAFGKKHNAICLTA